MSEIPKKDIKLEKKPNSTFYTENGVFKPEVAKSHYADLFQVLQYSLALPVMTEGAGVSLVESKLEITDFGLSEFSNVGSGRICFIADKEANLYVYDIYLLPFQMIPEYVVVGGDEQKQWKEAIQIRHGDAWFFSNGGSEADLTKYPPDIAETFQGQIEARSLRSFNGKKLEAGQILEVPSPASPHFFIAGAKGSITSVYTNFNFSKDMRYSNSNVSSTNADS